MANSETILSKSMLFVRSASLAERDSLSWEIILLNAADFFTVLSTENDLSPFLLATRPKV